MSEIKYKTRKVPDTDLWGLPDCYVYTIFEEGFYPTGTDHVSRFERRPIEFGGTFETRKDAAEVARLRIKTLT